MDNILTTLLKVSDVTLPTEKTIKADIMITVIDTIVNMTFELKDSDIDSSQTFEMIIPKITDRYSVNKKDLISSFYLIKPNCFSFWFYYKKLQENNGSVTEITKKILLDNKIPKEITKSINFLNEKHKYGKGIIYVTIDIRNNIVNGNLSEYKKFLEEKIEESLLIKASVNFN